MHVIILAVELNKLALKIGADPAEALFEFSSDPLCDNATAIFSDEDQVHVEVENYVSA
jgi:hypothetical protein